MNKTKKLTQGAMMLAILGAFALLDRALGEWLSAFVQLIPAVIIILYSTMHSLKDGVFLAIGCLILTFIVCGASESYIVYIPVSVFTGLVYSFCLKKNISKTWLLIISIISFVVGEALATLVVFPILGYDLEMTTEVANEAIKMVEDFSKGMVNANNGKAFDTIINAFKNNTGVLIASAIIMNILFLGVSEGILIHIIVLALFKKFRLNSVNSNNINIKPNKVLAYICMITVMVSFAYTKFVDINDNFVLFMVMAMLSLAGCIVLWFYGYLFVIIYVRAVMKIKVGPLLILILILFFSMAFIVIGFLYGAGPLQDYLDRKLRENINE